MTTAERDEKVALINRKIFPHTVPIILIPTPQSLPKDLLKAGSGALCPREKRLLITCHHVWNDFHTKVSDTQFFQSR